MDNNIPESKAGRAAQEDEPFRPDTGAPSPPVSGEPPSNLLRPALILGALAFVIYALTSPPGITWKHNGEDGAEFAAVGKVFGITHPTGYPLFTLLLRLVSLGAAETAWRATLLSNLAGAVTVALAALLFFEIAAGVAGAGLPRRPAQVAAIFGAAVFAISPLWWSQSVIIEVYALHLCFATLALWLAFRFEGYPRRLWILAYVAGLALAHHLQFVLLAPSLAMVLVASHHAAAHPVETRARWRSLLLPALLLFLVPITLYLVLMFRSRLNPPLDWGDPQSWKQLYWVVSGRQYRFRMFTSKLPEVWERARTFLSGEFPRQFGFLYLLAVVGLIRLARARWRVFQALLLYAILQLGFIVNYDIPDPDAYYLPVILVWTALLAVGVGVILASLDRKYGRPAAAGALIVLALFPLMSLPARWKELSLRADTEAAAYGRETLTALPPESIVLSEGDGRTFALWYERETTGRRDVTVIFRALLMWPWYRDNLYERDRHLKIQDVDRPVPELSRNLLAENLVSRPVFTTFDDRWLARSFRVQPFSHVFKVTGLRRPLLPPDEPVRWKAIDISGAANADYRRDPFTPGSPDSAGLFPNLGGGAIYWGNLPLMVARPQAATGRPSVFTTARRAGITATFSLAGEPTRIVCLLLDGGAIGHWSVRLGEARVNYTTGPTDTVEIRSYVNVWDYAAESYGVELPEDVVAWHGPHNQSLTVLPIPTDPARIPLTLVLTGEGPPGETGEPAGYTLFAATQWLLEKPNATGRDLNTGGDPNK